MRSNLRTRLVWTMSSMTTVALLALALALSMAAEEREEELIDEVVNTALSGAMSEWSPETKILLPAHLQFFRTTAAQTTTPPPAELLTYPVGNFEWIERGIEYHIAIREANGARWYMLYNTEEHERRLLQLRLVLLCAVALLSGVAWLLGRYLARGLLAQLSRLTESVQRDETPELSQQMDEEIAVLASAFTQYAAEKRRLLNREREFTAHVSHEIRTPLTKIRTSAELLLDTVPAQQQVRCEKIIAAVDELDARLRALLFLARDLTVHEHQNVALAQALNASVQRLPEKHADLQWHNQVAGDVCINADPALLALLLDNLLGNAWRYTQQGSVSASYSDGELTISDTGCGIAADAQPFVFEPYRRASTTPDGQGLGLAIVATICAAHQWTCQIDSTEHRGTKVRVQFAAA